MLQIVEILQELSKKIGDNVSIRIEFRYSDIRPPEVIFQADWPDDYRYQARFSLLRIESQPDDILKIFTYQAQRSYSKKITEPT